MLGEILWEMLQTACGKFGIILWRKAQGIDKTPVVPWREVKSISTEETFQQDTIDMVLLHREIV